MEFIKYSVIDKLYHLIIKNIQQINLTLSSIKLSEYDMMIIYMNMNDIQNITANHVKLIER